MRPSRNLWWYWLVILLFAALSFVAQLIDTGIVSSSGTSSDTFLPVIYRLPSPTPTFTSSPGVTATPTATASPTMTPSPTATATPVTPVPSGEVRPNDTYYTTHQWALRRIRAAEGWSVTTGKEVVIAVLDTGADVDHPDLSGRFVHPSLWRNFAEGGSDVDDGHGHGTHVTGIAAAATNNFRGVAGVNWGAKVLPLKVLDDNGVGTLTRVASAIRYAADNGARVINLSLASTKNSDLLQSEINYARSEGALVVVAAGNCAEGGPNCCGGDNPECHNPVMYPAAMKGTLAVAATTASDAHAPYSTYGTYIDVAAPGGTGSDPTTAIYSTIAGNSYDSLSGTSMATPHAAGLAALILGMHPSMTPDDVAYIIRSTARDLGASGKDPYFGHGRIDMRRALEKAWYWGSGSTTGQNMVMQAETPRQDGETAATDCSVPHAPRRVVVREPVDESLLRQAGLAPNAVEVVETLPGWRILRVDGSACRAITALNRVGRGIIAELDPIVRLPTP